MGRLILSILLCLITASFKQGPRHIDIITYHSAPPFIKNKVNETGLTYDLARFLTKNSNGKYKFNVKVLPRKRIDISIQKEIDIILPWVNPKWVNDSKEKKYMWSEVLFIGANLLISSKNTPFKYKDLSSFHGKKVSGLIGGKWPPLKSLIDNGKVIPVYHTTYKSCIKMAIFGRVDVSTIPRLVANHLLKEKGIKGKTYTSIKPLYEYRRLILIKENTELKKYINKMIPSFRDKYLLNRFGAK